MIAAVIALMHVSHAATVCRRNIGLSRGVILARLLAYSKFVWHHTFTRQHNDLSLQNGSLSNCIAAAACARAITSRSYKKYGHQFLSFCVLSPTMQALPSARGRTAHHPKCRLDARRILLSLQSIIAACKVFCSVERRSCRRTTMKVGSDF